MTTPRDILDHLLPYVATAGAYSSQIQKEVGTHDAKGGETIFHHALSDADVTIQSFLEVVLLAKFPHVSFFSEEQEQSLNLKYFAADFDLEVLLDPIDGTRSYIDNRTHYQIIVTIHDRHEIVGSLCYMPRRDRCYVATKGGGAFVLTRQEMDSGLRGQPLKLTHSGGPVLAFNAPQLVAKLSPFMETKDLVAEYLQQPGRYHSTDLIEGLASATLHLACQAIDGGSLALIASEAGAIVSHFDGTPVGSYREDPKRTLSGVVVALNPEVHGRIVRALAG